MTDILRFEGHRYYVAPNIERPGIAVFWRDPELDADAPERIGACVQAELIDSGDGWCYLPCRIAQPLGGRKPDAKPDGPWRLLPHPLRDQVRAHPLYLAGRDDLAILAVEGAPYAPTPFVPPAPYTPESE